MTLGQLGPHEVYLNESRAPALNARAGDRLTSMSVANRPITLTVRHVLRNEGLAAGGLLRRLWPRPRCCCRCARLQALAGQPGQINVVLISKRGDAMAGAALSDKVTDPLRAPLANPAQVAAPRRPVLRRPRRSSRAADAAP